MTSETKNDRARVIGEERGLYQLQFTGDYDSKWAVLAGGLRHSIQSRFDLPAVGDWVLASWAENQSQAIIHSVEIRKTVIARRAAGTGKEAQVLAANVDVAFIATSANMDLNLRRIERYLSVVWDSGARPVVLLTKIDLVDNSDELVTQLESIAIGVDIHAVSTHTGKGLEALKVYLTNQSTAVLLGSSGVGKSTLTNFLLGEEVAVTQGIRGSDGKGRHTTTSRHLFQSPNGGYLIDTPGTRELQLDDHEEGVQTTYADIEDLFPYCRFTNCSHKTEPGCAVLREITAGGIAMERFEAYQKLGREIAFQRRKEDPAEASRQREEWKKRGASGKAAMKHKRRDYS